MANYRPKSLNELNQVYGKAMKAEKAIKEGSLSLTKEDDHKENPEENIFRQLQQQASANKKQEIYDDEIANIANDFIKRFTESEKPKTQAAPKELRRPAPSIKSLYHTPVQPKEDEDVSQREAEYYRAPNVTPAVKPTAPQMLTPQAVLKENEAVTPSNVPEAVTNQAPKTQEAPEVFTQAPPTVKETLPKSEVAAPVVVPHREVSPTVHITSTERSSLMEEYQRVMSDDYDDDDDAYIEKKPKKRGLFSRKKKYRNEDEAPFDSLEENKPQEKDTSDEIPVTKFDSSNVKLASEPSQYPAEEEKMNLYDYIDADFDSDGSEEDNVEGAENYDEYGEGDLDEHLPMSQDDIDLAQKQGEEALYDSSNAQDIAFSQDEPSLYPAEETEKASLDESEAVADMESEPIEEADEEVFDEEVIIPEEEETAEEIVAFEETENDEEVEIVEPNEEPEELPTAGMTFDDVFSVTDESKRSYNGGNWADVLSDNMTDSLEGEDTQEDSYNDSLDEDEEDEEEYFPEEAGKKGGKATKVLLGLLIFISALCTVAVAALGSYIAPDTGKVFLGKYMAFTAEQDYSFIGVSAGDLVITDDSAYALEGDAFVYVNHDSQSFVMAKQSGNTVDEDGNVLFIAENEAGRVLVLREDTLGVITDTYSTLGGIISPISDNYIIVSAVFLLIILVAILLLVIPGFKKSKNKTAKLNSSKARDFQDSAQTQENGDVTPDDEEDEDDSDIDEDFDEFDPNGIEEGIFSEL